MSNESGGFSGARTSVEVFDTTLRDGLQVEGVSATVDDKLRIAEQLDYLGVHFIEGGWPGANPKDIEFFARAATELQLTSSTMVAFGSTRRPKGKVDDDTTLRNLLEANTSTVCIVAKSWDYHVLNALQTTLDEGEAMIADSVEFLAGNGRQVMVDMHIHRRHRVPVHPRLGPDAGSSGRLHQLRTTVRRCSSEHRRRMSRAVGRWAALDVLPGTTGRRRANTCRRSAWPARGRSRQGMNQLDSFY